MINESEIRKAINILKPNNQLFEIRVLSNTNKKTYSGYFKSVDTLMKAIHKYQMAEKGTFYFTLNEINEGCYDRNQKDCFIEMPKNTTSDNDITGYDWLMIDLDPQRPAGVSSSNEELEKAHKLAQKLYWYMRQMGFNEPIIAESGNGYHLLYKVCMNSNDNCKKKMKSALEALDLLFSTEDVKVDTANHNPSRICKLYGTEAKKGRSTENRPHRMSKILNGDAEIIANDIAYIDKIIDVIPKVPEKPRAYNNYNAAEFNLEEWLNRFNIAYKIDNGWSNGTKYILECCPFDSSHNGKDACLFKGHNGAIGFKCLHNSCQDKKWQDVRMKYEPTAYERKQVYTDNLLYGRFNIEVESNDDINQPAVYSPKDILDLPKTNDVYIKTGINIIDEKMKGLKKGAVTVVSGFNGSAKSTLLSEIILDTVNEGHKVFCYSGELTAKNFMKWLNKQAAGKANVKAVGDFYVVEDKIQQLIANWLDGKFWLYNNNFEAGNKFSKIFEICSKFIDEKGVEMIVLDNLMAFNINDIGKDKWDAQSAFVWSLHELAQKKNVHIIFVAHPRKSTGFLRKDDIAGTSDLTNAVDNVFIIHRNNEDFRRLSAQTFHWKSDNAIYLATNIVEIAKDRDEGNQDVFIPLWYEVETKRLKNNIAETKVYGWDTDSNRLEVAQEEFSAEQLGFTEVTNEDIPF